jgi:hypothetical protein
MRGLLIDVTKEERVMNARVLNGLIFLLIVAFGVVLLTSDRSISKVMEDTGHLISRVIGL